MDWTPVVLQGAVTLTVTTNEAVFTIQDGWVTGHCALSITASAGIAGNQIQITATDLPPPTNADAGSDVGTFKYIDASVASLWWGVCGVGTDGVFALVCSGGHSLLGVDPSFAAAGADTLKAEFCYRHA